MPSKPYRDTLDEPNCGCALWLTLFVVSVLFLIMTLRGGGW
jgi:hypothetical protein